MQRSAFFSAMRPPLERIELKRLDRVRIGNGQILIVTEYNPHKPANCYTGVLENGQGKPYVFGPKHHPVKIGEVTENHPAIQRLAERTAQRGGGVDNGSRAVILHLLAAVESGNLEQARMSATILRTAGFRE